MKTLLFIALILTFAALYSADITLTDGTLIAGDIKGIRDGNLYIVTYENTLAIIAFEYINQVNEGYGNIATQLKRRSPFMEIDPADYQLFLLPPYLTRTLPLPLHPDTSADANALVLSIKRLEAPLWIAALSLATYTIYFIYKLEK